VLLVESTPQESAVTVRWEFAEFWWRDGKVEFSHREPWVRLPERWGPTWYADTLTKLGDDGWELVSALPSTEGHGGYVFKRALITKPEQ
jgi:hypothetical protein